MKRQTGYVGKNIMMHLRKAALWVIAGVLLSLPGPCHAELAPLVLRDGRFEPAHNDRIRLDSVQVIMRFGYNSYTQDSVFELFNTGDRTTQWVGIRGCGGWGKYTTASPCTFIHFDIWVDGHRAPFTPQIAQSGDDEGNRPHIAGTRYDQTGVDWMVSNITFPGHAKTTVRVFHEVSHSWSIMNRSPRGPTPYPAGFSWENSRYWKGKIGKAVLVQDGSGVCKTKHPRHGPDSGVTEEFVSDYLVRYEREDFEPRP